MSLLKKLREWIDGSAEAEEFKEMWLSQNKPFFQNSSREAQDYCIEQAFLMCKMEMRIELLEGELRSLQDVVTELQGELT